MQAILTAGGTFEADNPLFIETGIAKKALLPMGGKPMIQWVAEALAGSRYVDGLVVVGLEPEELAPLSVPVHYAPNQGSIVDNALAGLNKVLEVAPDTTNVLVCSSDIPLLTGRIVDEFVETCHRHPAEVHYAVVEETVLEASFPNSKRTFTPMKGGRYSGGDLLMAHKILAQKANLELVRALTGERKNFFAQARMIGFGFIFRFIFRMMDLDEAMRQAGKKLNVNGHVLSYPSPELAMDVDKLHQYVMVKERLEALLV